MTVVSLRTVKHSNHPLMSNDSLVGTATDDDLSALSFVFGPMLKPALTLVDRGDGLLPARTMSSTRY